MRRICHFNVNDLCARVILNVCNSVLIAAVLVAVTGCDGQLPRIQLGRLGDSAPPSHFLGLIAGDEPNAVLAGRNMLIAHGNAMDAAVAVGLALAITLPSRAGFGGGGACVVHSGSSAKTEVLDFAPDAGTSPAAPPALARGLLAMHARYGVLPWAEVAMPAETLARFGTRVSRALARDLADAGSDLFVDSAAFSAFLTANRRFVAAGDLLQQKDLADYLAAIRTRGGAMDARASQGEDSGSSSAEGASYDAENFTPRWLPTQQFSLGNDDVYTLPSSLSGVDLDSKVDNGALVAMDSERSLPSGSGFTIADAAGNVVSCALTMGRPFGLGRVAHGLGFLLAPGNAALPLVPIIVIHRLSGEPRLAAAAADAGASGRVAAMLKSVARNEPLFEGVSESRPQATDRNMSRFTEVNAWFCPTGVLSDGEKCTVSADPQGYGYGLVVVPETKM